MEYCLSPLPDNRSTVMEQWTIMTRIYSTKRVLVGPVHDFSGGLLTDFMNTRANARLWLAPYCTSHIRVDSRPGR